MFWILFGFLLIIVEKIISFLFKSIRDFSVNFVLLFLL
jgi:hypothetical protein